MFDGLQSRSRRRHKPRHGHAGAVQDDRNLLLYGTYLRCVTELFKWNFNKVDRGRMRLNEFNSAGAVSQAERRRIRGRVEVLHDECTTG